MEDPDIPTFPYYDPHFFGSTALKSTGGLTFDESFDISREQTFAPGMGGFSMSDTVTIDSGVFAGTSLVSDTGIDTWDITDENL